MILVVSFFALMLVGRAATAPVDGQWVAWQNEPNGRGTFSILSSCMVTLVLCVYTAVHMNVPHASTTTAAKRWRLAYWVLAGTFAPEFVVWVAWSQWSEARKLTYDLKKMRNDLGDQDESIPLNTFYRGKYQTEQDLLASWTFEHSFFVVMGGYQFHPSTVEKDDEIGHHPRSILNASVVLELIKNGHADKFPLLSHKDITDRSKADNLAKTLSCIQGLWLVFQLLGRVMGKLTITELEVNTFAHVVCAIAMYGFWMFKPLNVEQPVYVDPEGLEPWILFHTGLDSSLRYNMLKCKLGQEDLLFERDTHYTKPITHPHETHYVATDCDTCNWNRKCYRNRGMKYLLLSDDVNMTPARVAWELEQSSSKAYFVDCVMYTRDANSSTNYTIHREEEYKDGITRSGILVTQKTLETYLRIWNLPNRDEELERYDYSVAPDDCAKMIPPAAYNSRWRTFSMIAISSCYGGLHATLWHHHFPTTTERWLWNVSSLVVAGNGFFAVIACVIAWIVLTETSERTKRVFGGHDVFQLIRLPLSFMAEHSIDSGISLIKYSSWTGLVLIICGIVAVQFVFVFCRMFLFVEAFISMRSQPPEVYVTPQWSQWLPHL